MVLLKKNFFNVAILLLAIFVILEYNLWNRSLFLEGPPIFSSDYIFRSLIIFTIAISFVLGTLEDFNRKPIISKMSKICIYSAVSGIVITALIVFILVYDVKSFSKFSLEDGWVEYLSALISFLSSVILLFTFFKIKKTDNSLVKWSVFLMSVILFILAMEEISWFQRILEYNSPKLMNGNSQNEMNLHNFGTNYIENAYYFGVFLLIVVVPFVNDNKPEWFAGLFVDFLIPTRGLMLIGCVVAGYNYDMWNVFFMQFIFYTSILILTVIFIQSKFRTERILILLTLGFIFVSQFLFLKKGEFFTRVWDVTEYRELLLPFGLFFYSVELYVRSRNIEKHKGLKLKTILWKPLK
tara:strand:+ start:11536 stop:12594 length:1059 start_codon:yes stop_codon:yes gene_type:complete